MNHLSQDECDRYAKLMDIMLNPQATEADAKYLLSNAKSGSEIAKRTAELHLNKLEGAELDVDSVKMHISVAVQLSLLAGGNEFSQHLQIQQLEKQFDKAS